MLATKLDPNCSAVPKEPAHMTSHNSHKQCQSTMAAGMKVLDFCKLENVMKRGNFGFGSDLPSLSKKQYMFASESY